MKKHLIIFVLALAYLNSFAQKKALTTDDFASWKKIENRIISANGTIVSYELNAQKGDGALIIYNADNNENDTLAYGYGALISPNSDFIALKLKPAEDTIRKLKLAKTKKENLPKDSLGIFNVATKEFLKFPNLNSFQLAEINSSWIAFSIVNKDPKIDSILTDTVMDKKASEEIRTESNSSRNVDKKSNKKKNKSKETNNLIILNPTTKQTFTFKRVEEFSMAKEGKTIALISKINDTAKIFSIITFNTENLSIDTLFQDSLSFKNLTLDKPGNQLAFLASADTAKEKVFSLYYAQINKAKPIRIIDTLTAGVPFKWAPSENATLYFSDDNSKLYLGTAPILKSINKDSILEDEIPKLDIWSWTDIDIQPMQLKNLDKEKKQTYLGVYRIKEKKYIQLADSLIKTVTLINKNNGEWALGSNDKPYKRATSWNGRWLADYYLINIKTGDKKLVLTGKSKTYLSPNGKYLVWYEYADSSFYALNNNSGKTISLTKRIPVWFCNEQNDIPHDPEPYGIAGWAENDTYLFIYDRFDIWKIDPSGKQAPVNCTNSFGRKNNIRFRYIFLEDDFVYIPTETNSYLEAFNEINNHEGYYSTKLNKAQNPSLLVAGAFNLGTLQKAKNADRVIWSKQTVTDYPEIILSNLNFNDAKTISRTNSQQEEYNWATAELVQWKSFTNDTLKGILYKPTHFDPTAKYPMVVYFYERSSQDINRHYTPYPSHSIINRTFYASNGYLVFVPDIKYTTGYPGKNAYDAIVSGVNYLIHNFSFVDANKIGLQGQSWGGYQIAYLITQTDMFAAAMAGAPVSNMTSAYGGIRWSSGMSRMFQYEHTQSRIGGTLWEKPMHYLENSPLFYAPKVKTPLLMMHNDNDGAVPWYQGIEYFMALRRLDKPVWLLNYNGMGHNIESKYWANRLDLSNRMFQFFNHYLKDEPAPEWMKNGLPAIQKGEKLGY